MDSLPTEIKQKILIENLSLDDIYRLTNLNREWRDILMDPSYWYHLGLERFPSLMEIQKDEEMGLYIQSITCFLSKYFESYEFIQIEFDFIYEDLKPYLNFPLIQDISKNIIYLGDPIQSKNYLELEINKDNLLRGFSSSNIDEKHKEIKSRIVSFDSIVEILGSLLLITSNINVYLDELQETDVGKRIKHSITNLCL